MAHDLTEISNSNAGKKKKIIYLGIVEDLIDAFKNYPSIDQSRNSKFLNLSGLFIIN